MFFGKPMLIFGLFWSGMVLLFDGFTVVPIARQILALRFPSTEGIILSSEVTKREDSEEGTVFGVAVRYRYTTGGREYLGRRYRYQKPSACGSEWAERFVAENPGGAKIAVYYNPVQPRDALLSPGVSGGDLFQLAFMTPFNAVMLGFWSAGWSRLKRAWFKTPAGGVRIVSGLRQTRARLTTHSPLASAVATAAGLAFLSLFIVGIGLGGFQPTMQTMIVTWSVILAGGFGAGVWHALQVLSGKYDLIIDELNGSLQLPLTHGRKTRQSVRLARIQGVFVSTIEKRSSDGDGSSTTYAPTLRVGEGEGTTERLVEWYDPEKARAFVEWLRESLPARNPVFVQHLTEPGRADTGR